MIRALFLSSQAAEQASNALEEAGFGAQQIHTDVTPASVQALAGSVLTLTTDEASVERATEIIARHLPLETDQQNISEDEPQASELAAATPAPSESVAKGVDPAPELPNTVFNQTQAIDEGTFAEDRPPRDHAATSAFLDEQYAKGLPDAFPPTLH